MNSHAQSPANPLVRVARALPAGAGWPLALGARIAGGALAIGLAADQAYDRTRLLAGVIAALTLVSCVPLRGGLRERLPWIGAGALFFGGALLAHLTAGLLVLLCGAIAALGTAIQEQHDRRATAVPSFFTGLGLVLVAVVAIVLGIEG
jgi:hypothetical protein